MTVWRTVGGVDWLTLDPAEVEDADTGYAQLGLVLAHGYAHESPADLGIGAVAAAVLEQVLGRPVETEDHRVVEPSVSARVGVQETVVAVSGEVAVVRRVAGTLEALLTTPGHLLGPELPTPRRVDWDGWGTELAAWFGVGPVSLAAETDEPWLGDPAQVADHLRSLHPGAGRRVVGWSTLPALVGTVLADPVPFPDRPIAPLRWREPAPCLVAGAVRASHTNNLLTARVASSALTDAALHLLGRTVRRSLVELTRQVRGLQVTWDVVDDHEYYALRALPLGGVTDWVAVRASLFEALDATADAPEQLLADLLETARRTTREHALLPQARRTLRTGVRGPGPSSAEELAAATVDDLRAAVRAVLAATLVSVPAGELPPPGRPLFEPPSPVVAHPTVTRRSRVPVWLRGIPDRQRVRADAGALAQTLTPKTRSEAPGALGEVTTTVDLTRLAVRVDRGDEYTVLVDAEDRRLTLVWPTYHRAGALRALVDAATRPGTALRRGADPMAVAQLRSDLTKARISRGVLAVLLPLMAVLVVWAPVTGTPEQDDVVTTVAVGQEVRLANGSTVRVDGPQWRPADTQATSVLVLDVRYCGGGVTVDDDTAEDARNYVTPDRFRLTGTASASRGYYGFPVGSLEATSLGEGQCTQGTVAFSLDAERPPGIVVSYRNGSGDQLGWTVT